MKAGGSSADFGYFWQVFKLYSLLFKSFQFWLGSSIWVEKGLDFERTSEHWKARKAQASQRHNWHRPFRPVTLLRHVLVERLAQNTARCGIWSAVQVFSTCQVIGRLIDSRTWGVMLECALCLSNWNGTHYRPWSLGGNEVRTRRFIMVCPKSKSVIAHIQKNELGSWSIIMRVRRNLSMHLTATLGFGHWVMDRPWNALVAGGEMWSLSLHGESHDSAVQVGQGLVYLDGCIRTKSPSNWLIRGIKRHDLDKNLVIYHDLCCPTIQIMNSSGQFQAAVAANVLAPPSLSLQQVVELQDH